MIFDCFLFFNELDLLKIRIEELKDVVDRFVLVEAPITHSGANKPLYFQLYRDVFSEYGDRIVPHVVSDIPRFARTSRFLREYHQRDAIAAALEGAGCKPCDVVLVSDVDEIPCGATLPEALGLLEAHDLVVFEQTYHQYYVNNIREHAWLGTLACRYEFLLAAGSVQNLRFGKKRSRRAGVDLRKTNIEGKYPRFTQGGWHLSWLGGPDAVLYKQQNYSHCHRDPTANRGLPYIRFNTALSKLVEGQGQSPAQTAAPQRNYDVDCRLPRYLSENRELFAHFFEPVNAPEQPDSSTELHGSGYSFRRRLYARVEALTDRARRLLWDRLPRLTDTLRRLLPLR